jgi:hypothetical protein
MNLLYKPLHFKDNKKMIEKLYGKYFQKSRSFLFPALGIKKQSYITPSGTYIAIDNKILQEDIKLICTYRDDESQGFKNFEEQMLIGNPLFVEKFKVDGFNIYVFDLEIYTEDYFNLLGKYSKLSPTLKRAIRTYYGENSAEYKYIDSYLYPDKYFETYAKLLGVSVNTLQKIGELCNPIDLDKETLKIPVEELSKLNKMI